MDNSNKMLHLCRLCLVKDDVNIPIFEEQGDIKKIFLKISSCLPVKVARDDQLPKKICDGCSYKLDMVYDFCNTSANSEKQLLTWLGEANLNSEMTDKNTESDATQQLKSTETFVKQEAIDPSDVQKEEEDDKSYMFQQKFDEEISIADAGPSATTTTTNIISNEEEEEEEPPPKRAKRTAAVKAAIAMDHESDDEDEDDSGEPLTKVEDESEDSEGEDHETPFVDVPSTSADDQPGPSGVGKDGVEAPFTFTHKSKDGFMRYVCLVERTDCFTVTQPCSKSKLHCAFCKQPFRDALNEHQCFRLYNKGDLEKTKATENVSKCGTVTISNIESMNPVRKQKGRKCVICRMCRIEFKTAKEYKSHYSKMHRPYNCKLCCLKFETRWQYRKHRYQVHEHEKYQICFVCGKTVINLSQHVKAVHGNPDEVKCPQCDKTFSCKKHLYRHKLVHSNEFKHKCSTCNKSFKTPFSLKVHKRSHDTVKPFECVICEKTFTTKQWRDNHQKTHR